ncbi:hypothetical protein GJ744_009584 [Endocarpon pusillum]|uniref:Uncharacterized protein n=1 Tax=Endocarpon pusillum TaxID=364733 RepID=A0A8H7AFH8_9EURO|nr:hypothetical protein GJ744_009584 [Endocarpon pusillum]
MGNYQEDNNRRQSAIQNLLSMFHLSNTSNPLSSEEEITGDVDEPPDEPLSPLQINPTMVQQPKQPSTYTRSALPAMDRKESLLTRALMTGSNGDISSSPTSPISRALSRASTFSNASVPSTAELTSDADDTSPARSATPSPPLPVAQYHEIHATNKTPLPSTRISFATSKQQEKLVAHASAESQIEAKMGRKRCITFACASKPAVKEAHAAKEERMETAQPPKRKCLLTFACPARPAQKQDHGPEAAEARRDSCSPPANDITAPSNEPHGGARQDHAQSCKVPLITVDTRKNALKPPTSPKQSDVKSSDAFPFHEFATGHDHVDAWVREPIDTQRKLTLLDCMKKENAIRKIGEEAEEEAEQEEKEEDEFDDDNEDGINEDDFAPSDDGNESDNEEGFAESDNDSDGESEDQFWIPCNNTTAATSVDLSSPKGPFGRRRQRGSSMDSLSDHELRQGKRSESVDIKHPKHCRTSKGHQMRPGTPELPDSTDFVCGTLDEDRPLEAAYISCREQRKREKHILIPQDIDPSFPTTDPEDMDEEDDEDLDTPEDHLWLKNQLEGSEDGSTRGHASKHHRMCPKLRSPRRAHSPPPKHGVHCSPPPPRQTVRRSSPAPNSRLFGHSPRRLHSPPPAMKWKSPPGTRRSSPTSMSVMPHQTEGLVISRLGQRPHMTGTASLPRTPNPFFHNYHARTQQNDRVVYGGTTPGREMHVRGPVDIVIGLEKKRQKRKEKFWRQHCRKAAKEQAERKTLRGRGAERMRELGLECAERTRGYGLGQQAPLVISL